MKCDYIPENGKMDRKAHDPVMGLHGAFVLVFNLNSSLGLQLPQEIWNLSELAGGLNLIIVPA